MIAVYKYIEQIGDGYEPYILFDPPSGVGFVVNIGKDGADIMSNGQLWWWHVGNWAMIEGGTKLLHSFLNSEIVTDIIDAIRGSILVETSGSVGMQWWRARSPRTYDLLHQLGRCIMFGPEVMDREYVEELLQLLRN